MGLSPKRLVYHVTIYLVIAFIGFADSVYLTATHYLNVLPVCTVIEGCDVVAMSEYATLGLIPVSLLGVIFYFGMLFSGFAWLDMRKSVFLRYLTFGTVPAFLFSAWLVYVMFFILHALCIYCLFSAVSVTFLMLLSFRLRSIQP